MFDFDLSTDDENSFLFNLTMLRNIGVIKVETFLIFAYIWTHIENARVEYPLRHQFGAYRLVPISLFFFHQIIT